MSTQSFGCAFSCLAKIGCHGRLTTFKISIGYCELALPASPFKTCTRSVRCFSPSARLASYYISLIPGHPTTPAFGMRVLVRSEDGHLTWGTINNHGVRSGDKLNPQGRWTVIRDDCADHRFSDQDQDGEILFAERPFQPTQIPDVFKRTSLRRTIACSCFWSSCFSAGFAMSAGTRLFQRRDKR